MEACAVLLILSVSGFALAFGIFVYFFDHFMGASDTGHLANTMSGMRDKEPIVAEETIKKLSAAATGR
jgi:hypothetical protein